MKGFLVGTLGMVALYVVVQPAVADKVGLGGNALVGLMNRFLSPNVAGVPDAAGKAKKTKK